MEALNPTPEYLEAPLVGWRDRLAPWIEGGLLALLVWALTVLGGDALRTSYHGYLHSSIGEAVLRDGLLPENPYHAGSDLRYYLLYPTLGVLLGRFGGGPLWGFAILNILAAACLGPALDALGRRLGLDFRARRFAFLAMVLAFNGLGWLFLQSSGDGAVGAMPLMALMDSTRPFDGFQWDGRLQAFLPKFLNVSSFALALPLALFSLAESRRRSKASLWRAALLLGLCTSINPVVGLFVGLILLGTYLPRLRHGPSALRELLPPALAAVAIALPFLLPVLFAAPTLDPAAQSPVPAFAGAPWANLLGPLALLWVLALLGLRHMPGQIGPWMFAVGLATVFCFIPLPWANEYKFPRLAGILLALPAGACLGHWSRRRLGIVFTTALLALCLPMTWHTAVAYARWDAGNALLLTEVKEGRLAPHVSAETSGWPQAIADAEAALPPDAVLMIHPRHPLLHSGGMGAQGNSIAPTLSHSLLVDEPQIHNHGLADLRSRLDAEVGFWEGRAWARRADASTATLDPVDSLRKARAFVLGRPLAVITLIHEAPEQRLEAAGGERLAASNGVALWLLPPLPESDGS